MHSSLQRGACVMDLMRDVFGFGRRSHYIWNHFSLFSNSSTQCGRFSWDLLAFLPQNVILKRQGQLLFGYGREEEEES